MELTKTFDWDMEKEYRVLETITALEFFDKYPNIIGIGLHRGKSSWEMGETGVDIVAFMTLGDYYKNRPPKNFFSRFRILGGMGIPALLPLQVYGHETIQHNMGFYFVQTEIQINGEKSATARQLLDTGASYCHITYPMWQAMRLGEKFIEENANLCRLIKIINPKDFEFENLPLRKLPPGECTSLGNGTVVTTYQIRIDKIIINNSNNPVEINNITARMIDGDKSHFIIGENVIKYLDITSKPVNGKFTLSIDFTKEGKSLMDKHRVEQNLNNMQTCYQLEPKDLQPSSVFQK